MKWGLWQCLYWLFWAVAFGVWELLAGVDKKIDAPMLTQAVVRWSPWWVTMPLLTWAWIHFFLRYTSPAYMNWLRTGAK